MESNQMLKISEMLTGKWTDERTDWHFDHFSTVVPERWLERRQTDRRTGSANLFYKPFRMRNWKNVNYVPGDWDGSPLLLFPWVMTWKSETEFHSPQSKSYRYTTSGMKSTTSNIEMKEQLASYFAGVCSVESAPKYFSSAINSNHKNTPVREWRHLWTWA